jgi:hypothetical protein
MRSNAGIKRQHHERQIGINDADIDGSVGTENAQLLIATDQSKRLRNQGQKTFRL